MATERLRAAAWKRVTKSLPDAARVAAPYIDKTGKAGSEMYDFCLPPAHATLSLLPEQRSEALELFSELGIPWHATVDGGPSNHLLSSQVQCVNALAPMVSDPSKILRAFGDVLDIAEVLEIEPGRFLTFEYIGDTDFFGEALSGVRRRGSHCTSVDAAFLHRTTHGTIELALVEWKYTETYRPRRPAPTKDQTRLRRYGAAFAEPDGPVRNDILQLDELFDEPLYQLVRQQLLADRLERSAAHGAHRVRVVHVAPAGNDGYQKSLHRPSHLALGTTVSEVWLKLLRHPDRFISLDSGRFLDPALTSDEYLWRYGDYLVRDRADAERICNGDVENDVYANAEYDGDVLFEDGGIELQIEDRGILLAYPFHLFELYDLCEEFEAMVENDEY